MTKWPAKHPVVLIKVALHYGYNNMAANSTGMMVADANVSQISAAYPGRALALSAVGFPAITNESITFELEMDGVGTGLTVTLDPTHRTRYTIAEPNIRFEAGALFGVRWTTPVGYLPVTADYGALVTLEA